MSKSVNKKIGRNDPCWCGSGQKYKRCHLERANEPSLPPQALRQHVQKEFEVKECLHPLASDTACGRIIAAHTIQRAGALRFLIDTTNHVRTFYPLQADKNGQPVLHKRGWREASTFSGFCDRHDGETFAPLEQEPFKATDEQCFLIAYRALCHEMYQKAASSRAHPILQNIMDRGKSVEEQFEIQHTLSVKRAGVGQGFQDAENKKNLMDRNLLNKDFRSWSKFVVRFEGDICVASTGAPTPTYDFNRKQVQVLHNPSIAIQHLLYGVVPIKDGGSVVFTWLSSDKACGQFVNSLEQISLKLLPGILVQFMFAHVENTYFSNAWWSSLNEKQQDHIKELAIMTNPYYYEVQYAKDIVVPWKITSIERT